LALQVKVGSVAKITTIAPPAVQQAVTGIGFQPKGGIFYAIATNSETANDHRPSWGFVDDSLNQRGLGWASADEAAGSTSSRVGSSTQVIRQITPGGSTGVAFRIVSWDADGFTIEYDNNNASNFDIYYIVFGGTDITDIEAGTFNAPTSVGPQDVTALTFIPDVVFFAGVNAAANIVEDHASMFMGVAKSATKQHVLATISEDARPSSESARIQRTNRCVVMFSPTDSTTIDGEASYTQALNNGFRLEWHDAPASANPIFYLAIKGGSWDVGAFDQDSDVGQQTVPVAPVVNPKFVTLKSTGAQASSSVNRSSKLFMGAAESSSVRHSTWGADSDLANPTITARGRTLNRCIAFYAEEAVANNSVLLAGADYVSSTLGDFTIDWITNDGVARQILYVTADNTVSTTMVKKVQRHVYNVFKIVKKTLRSTYHVGGEVRSPEISHRYHVLARVKKVQRHPYGIQNFIKKVQRHPYHVSLSTSMIKKVQRHPYGITNLVTKIQRHLYSISEDPSVNSKGYGKQLRPRIYIMDNTGNEILHEFNAFRPDESDIRVLACDTTVSSDSAGDFTIRIEDHVKAIDPTIVGNGCLVLIQAAKTEDQLDDGRHDLMLGYIKTAQLIRQDTNTLEYEYSGQGAMIRMNERITTFNYAARRMTFNSSVADKNDQSMYAMNIVKRLIQSSEHLPMGTPLENQFTLKGTLERQPVVNDFIPAIEEDLTEFSDILDIISDATGARWGVSIVDRKPDLYLHYGSLEHSGITIKDKVAATDDRYRTAYLVGPWNFEDSTRKEDGFSNRFFARSGSKSVSSNVISISNISDNFTALAVNQQDSGETPPPTSGEPPTTTADIGTIVPFYIYPGSEWTSLANIARQYPRVRFIAIINPNSGPGSSQDQNYVTGIRNLQSAGIMVLGYVATGYTAKAQSTVQTEVDRYINWYDVDGIFWDEQANDTGSVSYYASITNYVKTTRGLSYVSSNPGAGVPEAFFSGTSIDSFHIYENSGLPSVATLNQSWFVNYPRKRRAVIPYGVSASESTIRTFTRDCVNSGVAGFVYVQNDGGSNPWDTISSHFTVMVSELDSLAAQLTQTPTQEPTTPAPTEGSTFSPTTRDLAQSFIPDNQRLSDLVIILSKVGNPKYQDTNIGIGTPEASIILPNSVHGHIETNKVVTTSVVDPSTNEESIVETSMPSGFAIAYFNVPFDQILNQTPTACFLNDIVYDKGNIVPGQRYWVVLYGRGQDEANTIRWHHSDDPQFEMLSATRIPGGHNTIQQWQVFQEPAFAMSIFDTTLQFTEASDPDSIEQFGLVESSIDVSFINEEEMIAKFLQTLLQHASKPKRIYEINRVTAPDELILPGFLVNIIDEMSTHEFSGSVTEAEIIETHYDFSDEGLGTRFIDVKPLGYVDFAFAKWMRKLERGEITIPQEGDPVIIQPPAGPGPQPPPPICPVGHHYDANLERCVPDEGPVPPQLPSSPTPPDLRPPVRIFLVTNVTDWIAAINNAQAGDEIVVRNGTYNISPRTFSSKAGTVANPITIRAEFVGGVILTGGGAWKFNNCQNVNWYGFNHRHAAEDSSSILFSGCTNCRFARCDVMLSGSAIGDWVSIDGGNGNRVDHNILHDKSTQGRFVRVGEGGTLTQNTIVELNYFRNHSFTGTNGGEAFENGASASSLLTFGTICRLNLFENCRGDAEVISNKSCGNSYLRNAFVNCRGSLTLRHGSNNIVMFNYFDGNSGVRIYGANNVIARNMFTNHSGNDGITAPIYVGMGTVETPPTGSHANYERVVNNQIILNTIHNGSAQTTDSLVHWGGVAGSGTLAPSNNVFRGNVVVSASGTLFQFRNGSDADGDFGNNDNIFWITGTAVHGDLPNTHWENFDPLMTRRSDGVYRIAATSEATNEFPMGTFSQYVNEDLDGESTVGDTIDAGSDQFSTAGAAPIPRRTPTNTGPSAP
jgi:poly(beta-D-mannuronate) lyase